MLLFERERDADEGVAVAAAEWCDVTAVELQPPAAFQLRLRGGGAAVRAGGRRRRRRRRGGGGGGGAGGGGRSLALCADSEGDCREWVRTVLSLASRRSLLALQRADRELGPEADEAHELLRDWELVDVAR